VSVYRIAITNVHILNEKYSVVLVFICAIAYWKLVSYYAPLTYECDDFLADLCQAIVVLTLLMGMVIQQFGCPTYYKSIFIFMIVVVIIYVIATVLMDTAEERVFIWVRRRELFKSLRETPAAVKSRRASMKAEYDESDL